MRAILRRVVLTGFAAALAAYWVASHDVPAPSAHPFARFFQAGLPWGKRPTRDDSTLARAPWVAESVDRALASPRFDADRRAFKADLMRRARISGARADTIATAAVREAYKRRIPPALVFGVMMAENEHLRSTAASSIGAVGLMQVDPRAWLETLGGRFGTDLQNDHINLRYGVFILGHYIHGATNELTVDEVLRRGLLRYNGCVRGARTPNCHSYPAQVRARIERLAISQCSVLGFERCVADPLRLALLQSAQPALGD